jgi:hypothetical protein
MLLPITESARWRERIRRCTKICGPNVAVRISLYGRAHGPRNDPRQTNNRSES